MVVTECQSCGKQFFSYPSHQRQYCSVECSRQKQGVKGKRWTLAEETYITNNYSILTAAEIAKHLNRTETAVTLHIHYFLKLRKNGYSQMLQCDNCGKQFTRYPSFIRQHPHIWGNFCNRKCRGEWISVHIIGETHPNWQGGKMPYTGQWRQVRRLARKRAKGSCEVCGKPESENGRRLDTHHIIGIRQFLWAEMAHYTKNVICLCRSCHIKAHHPS